MQKAIYIGVVAAVLVGGCHPQTPATAEQRMSYRAAQTGASAQYTGQSAWGVVRHTGGGIGHAAAGTWHGLEYVGREVGATITGHQHNPATVAREQQAAMRARAQFHRSGQEFGQAGGSVVGTGVGTVGTTVHGLQTVGAAGRYGVSQAAYGGGPQQRPARRQYIFGN
jgi:hypothetical protein